MDSNTLKRWWAVLLAATVAIAATATVTVSQGDHSTSVNVTVNGQLTPAGATGPTSLVVDRADVKAIAETNEHKDLGGAPTVCTGSVTVDCVTNAELAAGVKQVTALAKTDKLPEYDVAAASELGGCKSRFIKRNYSSRNGVRPRLIVLHQTISPDNGWAGVNSITAYFNTPGPAVSSSFVVAGAKDACNYIVPMSQKPWTQTGFNSLSISIEVTGTQSQGYYVKGPGRERLARTIARIGKAWGIPIRRGAVSGCTVTRSGVVDHDQLGACGGYHNDISPYRGTLPGLIETAHHYRVTMWRTPTQRRCDELRTLRARAQWRKRNGRTPTWTKERAARARILKSSLGSKASSCR